MEASATTMLHPARWLVKPFGMAFYWPTTLQDAIELIRRCKTCQFYAKQIHTPAQMMQMISPSWSFVMWGLDILGLFSRAFGGFGYLYVAVDKFTKWPEATPVVKINKQYAFKFIKLIFCRFGVSNRIITNNGSQFTSRVFQEYCEDLGIQIFYASIAHPESNGQVARAIAVILRGLKTRTYDCLKKNGAKWIDELLCALWVNQTSSSWVTRETSFFLVYGAEAVIPLEITMVSPVFRHTTKLCRTNFDVMMLTSSMN
jgi:transposase InsO family protein